VQTVRGDSAEPVQMALGELFGDVSGVPWASASERDPELAFDLKFVEPKPEPSPAAGVAYLAVTRALLDRGSAMQFTELVQPRVPPPSVEINSHDAEEWSIANGDTVRLTLETKPPRALELRAHADGQVPRGVLAVDNNLEGTMNLPMGARVRVERN
jgi:anaerobic selenocysteine-containing dehydrogenase